MGFDFIDRPTTAEANAPTFKLLSFNILSDNFENSDVIAQTILSSGADLVNVMEAGPIQAHLDELSRVYPYRVGCGVLIAFCDQLMLSKTPIQTPVVKSLSDIFRSRFVLAKVAVAGRVIAFAGIHTTKPYFDDFHSFELGRAALAITDIDGPLLISGDFNASSLAPNMRRFLSLTQLKTGGWEPATWPIRAGRFGVPIDHVYARAPLKIKSVRQLPDAQGSNHYGLIAEIAITGS
jgi:endonuclease/exonuclease/phosphatase (EEP) superfamily protein YafD